MRWWCPAPGRPRVGRPGAFLFWLACASVLVACGGEGHGTAASRHRLPLGRDTLDLGADVTVHEVRLGGTGAGTSIQPETVRAVTGDVVRFVAADSRGNAVAFQDSGLAPPARQFLVSSRQLRGPPLVSTGASWVVSLKNAPSGAYPFRSLTRGARGVLLVAPGPAK